MDKTPRPIVLEDLERFFEWCLEHNIEILDPRSNAQSWLQAMDGFYLSDLRHLCNTVKEMGAVPELRICLTLIKSRMRGEPKRPPRPLTISKCKSCGADIV